MNNYLLLLALAPVLGYFICTLLDRERLGIAVALGFGTILTGYIAMVQPELDWALMVEYALLAGCSLWALWRRSPLIFKLQPVLSAALIVGILAFYQFFHEPYFVVTLDRLKALSELPPLLADNPMLEPMLAALSWQLIILCTLHGIWVTWAAWHLSPVRWALVRMAILPAMFALTFFNAQYFLT